MTTPLLDPLPSRPSPRPAASLSALQGPDPLKEPVIVVNAASVLPSTARRQCGSDRGYRLHLENNELACDPCLAAHSHTWSDWSARSRAGHIQPAPLRPCGTLAAYKRHKRRREPACEPCRRANRLGRDLSPGDLR